MTEKKEERKETSKREEDRREKKKETSEKEEDGRFLSIFSAFI